jgi:hypothetical protein
MPSSRYVWSASSRWGRARRVAAGDEHGREVVVGVREPWPRAHAPLEVDGDLQVALGVVVSLQRPRQHAEGSRHRAEQALARRDRIQVR